MNNTLTIALSKGRILDDTLPLFAAAGIEPLENPHTSRKLIFETNQPNVQLLVIRAADVPTYVQYGGADCGVSGKDVLLEHGSAGLYEPLDLNIARCRLSVAGRSTEALESRERLRVATKYVNLARDYFADTSHALGGRQIDIVKLYGGMELAPLVGMADVIVDLVDTGNTLKANGLRELQHIADISSRFVINKAALKMKEQALMALTRDLEKAVDAAR